MVAISQNKEHTFQDSIFGNVNVVLKLIIFNQTILQILGDISTIKIVLHLKNLLYINIIFCKYYSYLSLYIKCKDMNMYLWMMAQLWIASWLVHYVRL